MLRAERATSKVARSAAKVFKGYVGDPWAPVHETEGKSLTLSGGNFDYAQLCKLLFSGEWKVPLLAQPHPDDGDEMLLVAEALSRGNSKTEGFKSRVLRVPGTVARLFSSERAATLAKAQLEEVKAFDSALRNGLALAAAGGSRESVEKTHYAHTIPARKQFDRIADALFFPNLWKRVEAGGETTAAVFHAKRAFLEALKKGADHVFNASLPAMPCTAIHRPRAEARARGRFMATLRTSEACRELFITEETDAAA